MTATAVRRPPSLPADRQLPGAAAVLTTAGAGAVGRFLDERGLDAHRVEPVQAHYRPGQWLAVCFRTGVVERSSGRPLCPIVTVECRAGEPDRVWAFPDDPALPGLAASAHPASVRRRLRPHPGTVTVEPLRYRPRRRAVLRYRLDGGRVLFGKVVTPARGRRQLAWAAALRPSGLSLALPAGRIGPGALILPALPGTPLRDLILGGRPCPSPERIAKLPEELHEQALPALAAARIDLAGERAANRRSVDPATALGAARMVSRLLPAEACAAGRLAEAIVTWAEESEPPETRIVHGDLYENQVLVDRDRLGLIDLDDLGPGDALLDAANFSAHLLVLGTSGPSGAAAALRYREELRAAFLHRLDADPAALAWREAYCLLRLVPGPFRALHPEWPRRMADRLALATAALSIRRRSLF